MDKTSVFISPMNIRFTVRFTVICLLAAVCCSIAALTVFLQYHYSTQQLEKQVLKQFEQVVIDTKSSLQYTDSQAKLLVDLLAVYPDVLRHSELTLVRLMSEMIKTSPVVYGIYFGRSDGSFFEVINLNVDSAREAYFSELNDAWVTLSIDAKKSNQTQILTYYDADLNQTNQVSQNTSYNPTKRPWYVQAKEHTTRGQPYLFQLSQQPGITYSRRLTHGQGVVGLDISLSNLSQRLAKYADMFEGEAYLIKKNGELIAQHNNSQQGNSVQSITPLTLTEIERQTISQLGTLTISNVSDWQPIDFSLSGMPKGYGVDVLKLVAEKLGLQISFINGYVWADFVKQFGKKDIALLNGVFDNQENRELGLLSDPYGNLPLGLVVKGQDNQYSSLTDLHGKTLAIGDGWSVIELIKQAHPEINIVTFNSVQALLNGVMTGDVDAVLDSPIILEKSLTEFSVKGLRVIRDFSLSDVELDTRLRVLLQKEHGALLPLFNRAIEELHVTHIPQLQKKWLKSNDQNAKERVVPYIKNIKKISNENIDTLVHIKHEHKNKLLYMSQLDSSLTQNQFLVLAIDEEKLFKSVYESVTKSSLITIFVITVVLIPLTYLCASPLVKTINTLLLQTKQMAKRDYSAVKISSTSVIEIKRLSIAIKKASLSLRRHEIAQRNLIDAMIQLIAQAIDQKSPYTGAHCNRVPILGEMLLTAAHDSKEGIFNAFEFHTAKDWREFKTASWLHDCGKITTPEHIVDKGSKLECIYNRIHEIRMRFEVLHRDAEISYLTALQQTPEKQQDLLAKRDARQQQLQEYFLFIAKANIGSEFMSDEAQQKIHKLANQIWVRHFDDRLGLSPAQERELPAKDRSLPAIEYLLADKQDHITHRVLPYELPDKLGIKMKVPNLVSNQGEIYNLCISRGTLTAEDRFTINEHIISTIKILDQVPFPPELANVPRLASTHHETMRGDGYPRKLHGSQLSIPERILAVADIFEALTASDRPYKKAKSLSVALDILHNMAKEQHIDINIFNLFIESKIYLEYAHKFLPKSQINAIDESRYLT